MSLMLGALYDALRQAPIPDDLARKAAEEVAGYENRLAQIESRLTLLTWMVGLNIALTFAILGKLLTK
jgi:hypothetical protein